MSFFRAGASIAAFLCVAWLTPASSQTYLDVTTPDGCTVTFVTGPVTNAQTAGHLQAQATD